MAGASRGSSCTLLPGQIRAADLRLAKRILLRRSHLSRVLGIFLIPKHRDACSELFNDFSAEASKTYF